MLLEWLCDKVSDSIRKDRNRRYDEEQSQKREKAWPVINDLCRAELQRIAKNPAIDMIYDMLFHGKPPVIKITVYCSSIKAFYNDDTSYEIVFATLGMSNLSYENCTIFMNNPIVHEPHWYGYNSGFDLEKYPYLYFCTGPRSFNECRAVGYLLAEKTGLQYDKPDSCVNAVDFVFPTNKKVLKSW